MRWPRPSSTGCGIFQARRVAKVRRVLGVDPGLRITGYGCVEVREHGRVRLIEAGVFRFKAGLSVSRRLAELDHDLGEALDRLAPDVVAVEKLFAHYNHPRTAIIMGHGRGVILLGVERAGRTLVELSPNEVKRSLTGHGHAGKEQMQDAVRAALGLPARPEPPDVADALAIAMCAASRSP
ncbi:MAG: crossover junction endodeoxyribonuclease RuvC [Phycisphaerae bacterium]|nr:crossover junction endodeoxyribonuclease RuvC [Phycisphaerae bacterium]